MKRVFLFLATNIAILVVLSITLSILGVDRILDEQNVNLDMRALLIFYLVQHWLFSDGEASVIYGAYTAWVQRDLKKLIAYSSVSHMGFILLGLFAMNQTGISGAILQMINHGVSTGALFILVGVIYDRRHTRMLDDFGGLAKVMPWYTLFFVIITMSSIGLPGTNGFIGEFMSLAGAFFSRSAVGFGDSWLVHPLQINGSPPARTSSIFTNAMAVAP